MAVWCTVSRFAHLEYILGRCRCRHVQYVWTNRPHRKGAQCDIFWPMGPLYGMLQHKNFRSLLCAARQSQPLMMLLIYFKVSFSALMSEIFL